MNMFTRAPIIARTHTQGIFAEGDAGEAELERTFGHAVDSFGFLLERGQRVTGSQWIAAIKKTYGDSELRVRAVIEAIEKVMLVRQFSDDHILFDSVGSAQFRGTGNECMSQALKLQSLSFMNSGWKTCSIDEVGFEEARQAELAMARRELALYQLATIRQLPGDEAAAQLLAEGHAFKVSYVDLPADHLVCLGETDKTEKSLLARVHRLLDRAPVGPQEFTESEAEDRQANLVLMLNLMRHLGYGALVTAGAWKNGPRPQREKTNIDFVNVGQVEEAVASFFDSLIEGGWNDSRPVYLCRPAPIINPLASVRPFESVMHSTLVGWRLPQGLVETFAEEARERCSHSSVQKECAR